MTITPPTPRQRTVWSLQKAIRAAAREVFGAPMVKRPIAGFLLPVVARAAAGRPTRGVLHCWQPVPLRAREALVTVAWVAADGEPAKLRTDLVHPVAHEHDTTWWLLPQELDRLITRLGIEVNLHCFFLSAPVVHARREVA